MNVYALAGQGYGAARLAKVRQGRGMAGLAWADQGSVEHRA